jgi:hypothetical protein
MFQANISEDDKESRHLPKAIIESKAERVIILAKMGMNLLIS